MVDQTTSQFVYGSISVDGEGKVEVSGCWPFDVNGHSVFLGQQRGEMFFNCCNCDERLSFSESVWVSSANSERAEAMEYAFGHFIQHNCGCPDEVGDAIRSVKNQYLGNLATPDTLMSMEREVKAELLDV